MNLIYIVNIKDPTSRIDHTDYTQYTLESWKYWCNKNNVDLFIREDTLPELGRVIWNKERVYEVGKDYEHIGVVDADTMIKWDAPNIFDLIGENFCMVKDQINLDWSYKSIHNYHKFFPELYPLDIFNYGNAGVLFFNRKYLFIFEQVLNFYLKHKEELDNWNKGGGREQTILNYHLKKNNVEINWLSSAWNIMGMKKLGWLGHNWQLNSRAPHFLDYGYIWHFTGFPIEERVETIKNIWEFIKTKYR